MDENSIGVCAVCGKTFAATRHANSTTYRKTCSTECRDVLRRNGNAAPCPACGADVWVRRSNNAAHRKFCNAACRKAYTSSPVIPERFWSKVDKSGGPDACWPWTGKGSGNEGYGAFFVDGKAHRAHRIAFELASGEPIPDGLHVCHSCDNPPCVNPTHLWLGTALDNRADCEAKGRGNQPRGTATGRALMTDDDVRAIRAEYLSLRTKHRVLAKRYGVARSTISYILRGETWTHV